MSDMDLSPRHESEGPGSVPTKRKRNLVPILALVAVFIAGGVIITQFLNTATDYFCNVDEVGVVDGCDSDRRIRLQGTVDPGTLDESAPGVTLFTMSFNDVSIPVRYDGTPAGIFQECIPVVVLGEITEGVLLGDEIQVKHSDEYQAENDDNLAEADEYADEDCGATA